jgi:hypothetical protein
MLSGGSGSWYKRGTNQGTKTAPKALQKRENTGKELTARVYNYCS